MALAIDKAFNFIVGAKSLDDYVEPRVDRLEAWPEAVKARQLGRPNTEVRNAPDLSPVISSAVPFDGGVLLATDNDRTFTKAVRRERGLIVGAIVNGFDKAPPNPTAASPLTRAFTT